MIHQINVFSACAEVVPMSYYTLDDAISILRVRGGSSYIYGKML